MSKRTEKVAIAGGFACLAIATTWPLVLGLGTHLPSDLGDPVLTAWTLAWDASRASHGLVGLWDAPNFFPYRHTLAYSDHLLGIALFTAPLQALTHNPVLVYNLAFLASVMLSGIGMYVLARSLTDRRDAALVAGVIYACLPFRASHLAHLQWLMVGWLPLGLWALHRYFRGGAWRHLAGAVACFLLQAMTAMYFVYFALVPFGVVALAGLAERRVPLRRLALHLLPLLVVAAAALAPTARAYYVAREESGLRREVEDIAAQSADVADYFQPAPRLRIWGPLASASGEHHLFPGSIAILLGVTGAIARRRSAGVATYLTITGLAFVLSLGPAPAAWGQSLHVPGPYSWLLAIVPGLDGLRAVARLGLIVALALAVLSAFGAAWLLGRLNGRAGACVASLLVAGVIAEGWAVPIPTPAFAASTTDVEREAYEYLRRSPPGGVLELPASVRAVQRESRYQYLTLLHGHPTVNGQSGHVPPLFNFLAGAQSPLNEAAQLGDALAALRAVGVRYLVLHHDAFDEPSLSDAWRAALAKERAQIVSERRFGETTVVALRPVAEPPPAAGTPIPSSAIHAESSHSQDRLALLFDGDVDSRWLSGPPQGGDEWISLGFDRPRDVAVIGLRMAERSFGDYPRELTVESISDDGSTTVFRGSVLPALTRGVLERGDYPEIALRLPANRSRGLRLRQLGRAGRFFWSIHELRVLER